jgi:hypothetical protein
VICSLPSSKAMIAAPRTSWDRPVARLASAVRPAGQVPLRRVAAYFYQGRSIRNG